MKKNDKLNTFVKMKALQHSPFKRENNNSLYQEKYIEIFNLIYNRLENEDDSVRIKQNELQDVYRNYKRVLLDLYNDKIIYFSITSSGSLLHGNVGFSEECKGDYSKCFTSFYRLDVNLVSLMKNNESFQSLNSRNTDKLNKKNNNNNNNNNITNINKIIRNNKQIKITASQEKITNNIWYNFLTYEDGRKVMEDLPHYGSYEDGRIYSRFHSMKREIRKHLLLCGSHIKEVFDVSHCFPTLIGVLIDGKLPENVVNDYRSYIMNNDVYMDAVIEAGLDKTTSNRNKIKPYFNKFILSTIKDVKRNMKWEDKNNDPVLFSAVVNFFKNKFPEIFDFIYNYETIVKNVKGKSKRVKKLAHDLQIIEKVIIDKLTEKIKDLPYLTLHDAIYIKEDDFEKIDFLFEEEFRKIINF